MQTPQYLTFSLGRQVYATGILAIKEIIEYTAPTELDIPESDIESAPDFGTNIRSDFIAGMARVDGSFVVVLDAGRVLAFDELEQFADTMLETPGEAA
ncbi:chemotaxis protein CheW [Steroidobacter flavus]|uniref:Chemotaxis protein CheW n=1 Tax=Steroidobacter flavus TaxID=1842136 RepID=A0ABV8T3R0_9GAMM